MVPARAKPSVASSENEKGVEIIIIEIWVKYREKLKKGDIIAKNQKLVYTIL